jgi:hypothetical protein
MLVLADIIHRAWISIAPSTRFDGFAMVKLIFLASLIFTVHVVYFIHADCFKNWRLQVFLLFKRQG